VNDANYEVGDMAGRDRSALQRFEATSKMPEEFWRIGDAETP